MLVLKRHLRQRIIITTAHGERIAVELCYVGNNWAKIGIEAPPDVAVWREEIQPANEARGE